jgi:hypothetical protein
VDKVFTSEECQALRNECRRMVDDFDLTQHPKTVFVTGKEQVGSVLI